MQRLSTSAMDSAPNSASGAPLRPSATGSAFAIALSSVMKPCARSAARPSPTLRLPFPNRTASNRRASNRRASSRPARAIPVTYVPFRNAHFLSVAVSWAEVLGATKIYIGAVEPDSSGYPDCRPEYYSAFNEVVRTGTRDGTIQIVTPLIAMRKHQIVRLGLELNAPFDLTWSCYQREDRACGVCDSCLLRLRAFREAGAEDPIPYAPAAK